MDWKRGARRWGVTAAIVAALSVLVLLVPMVTSATGALVPAVGASAITNSSTQCSAGSGPYYPGYDPVNHDVYIPDWTAGKVTVMNGTCHLVGTVTLPVGATPWQAAFDPANNLMYVSDDSLNAVYTISGTTLKNTITNALLTDPQFLLWDPGDSLMLVENSYGSDAVVSISGTGVVGSTPVGLFPSQMCYDPYYNIIVVVNYGSDNVTILNAFDPLTGSIANHPVGTDPEGCAFDVADSLVYVTNLADDNVSVLNDGIPINSVSVGSLPSGIVWDQADLRVYVVNTHGGNVSEISGYSVVKTLHPGDKGGGMTYDEATDTVYLSSYSNNKVYVLT